MPARLNRKGRILGCVVAVGKGLVGYSQVHKKDKFSKKLAKEIAAGRAWQNQLKHRNQQAEKWEDMDIYNDAYTKDIFGVGMIDWNNEGNPKKVAGGPTEKYRELFDRHMRIMYKRSLRHKWEKE